MDGLEFLSLLDACVHGPLHSLNAFALRVQLMTHLIEEGLQFCKLRTHLRKLPVALDEQLIPFAQLLLPAARASLATPASTHKAHLCSKSASDVCKHGCSARAPSSLTSNESALLRQDRLSSHSSRRHSCVSRRSTAACSYSSVRVPSFSLQKTSDFIECFVEVADPRLHPVPSRQSNWTFMSSSMRIDVTRVCLQRASGSNLCVRVQR